MGPDAAGQEGLHQGPERGAIAEQGRVGLEAVAGHQDRHAMAAQVAAHHQLVACLDASRPDRFHRHQQADAAGGEEGAIRLTPLHHLGVPRDHLDGTVRGGGGHRGQDAP